jgi:hypothetical protein
VCARYKRGHHEKKVYKKRMQSTLLFFTLVWVAQCSYRIVVAEGWNRIPPVVLGLLTAYRHARTERAISKLLTKSIHFACCFRVGCTFLTSRRKKKRMSLIRWSWVMW